MTGLIDRLRERLPAVPGGLPDGDYGYVPEGPLIEAAVLVPIVLHETPTVLLTQRTAHLRDHAGQVSFPGGRRERSDASPEATALREAQEEVGLDAAHVELIGRLPLFVTITGFLVTPVVGLVRPPFRLAPDSFEVAEVFEPPLAFLLDPANHRRHDIEYAGRVRHYWSMPWQGFHIWGATAAMLRSMGGVLESQAEVSGSQ